MLRWGSGTVPWCHRSVSGALDIAANQEVKSSYQNPLLGLPPCDLFTKIPQPSKQYNQLGTCAHVSLGGFALRPLAPPTWPDPARRVNGSIVCWIKVSSLPSFPYCLLCLHSGVYFLLYSLWSYLYRYVYTGF